MVCSQSGEGTLDDSTLKNFLTNTKQRTQRSFAGNVLLRSVTSVLHRDAFNQVLCNQTEVPLTNGDYSSVFGNSLSARIRRCRAALASRWALTGAVMKRNRVTSSSCRLTSPRLLK